ncbi:ABC transporter permease [Phytohabitans kaempferiae]|uniref:ABC transporter permease n=1 Tax=Phytohabitans kaempferiae TaxID=1620943 RepID=A0ABV6MIN7_9ACTN
MSIAPPQRPAEVDAEHAESILQVSAAARVSAHRRFVARYVTEKVLSAVFVLWAAASLSFLAVHLAPGDPALMLMGEVKTPELRATIEADWGLDEPLITQYLDYFGRLLSGDLGYSYVQRVPVNEILFGPRLLNSAKLTVFAALLAVLLAVVVAVLSASRRGPGSALLNIVELTFASVPSFWLGLVLISVFAFGLGWFPVTAGSELQKLILPGFTLALPLAAVLAQVIREGIERSLEQPYSVTALMRGISHAQLKRRHALRHSLIPATTLAGWSVGGMLTGTVIVEQVFGRSGIGQATVTAVRQQDIPVVLGIALAAATIYVLVNTVVDILYVWIDPRLKAA